MAGLIDQMAKFHADDIHCSPWIELPEEFKAKVQSQHALFLKLVEGEPLFKGSTVCRLADVYGDNPQYCALFMNAQKMYKLLVYLCKSPIEAVKSHEVIENLLDKIYQDWQKLLDGEIV